MLYWVCAVSHIFEVHIFSKSLNNKKCIEHWCSIKELLSHYTYLSEIRQNKLLYSWNKISNNYHTYTRRVIIYKIVVYIHSNSNGVSYDINGHVLLLVWPLTLQAYWVSHLVPSYTYYTCRWVRRYISICIALFFNWGRPIAIEYW